MIKKVEFQHKKPHLRYDADARKWIGYQVDIRSGRKRLRPVFATKKEADSFVTKIRSSRAYAAAGFEPTAHIIIPIVSKLFAERLKEIRLHAAQIRATRVFREFESLLAYDLPVTNITRSHFRLYIKKRQDEDVKNETINREINELSAAFNRAVDIFPEELEDFEPKIARPTIKRGKRPRREITEEEIVMLAKAIRDRKNAREYPTSVASRPIVALMFELAWLLGLRIGETERLLKKDFNRKKRSLRVIRWKTNTETIFNELPDRVIEIFDEAVALSNKEVIFDVTCSRHTVEKIIRDACESIDIPYGRGKTDAITFHSTRHSFASRLVRVTDPATAASFTGHSSLEMLDYYSHANEESRRKAMDALYGKNGTKKFLDIFENVRSGKMDFEEFLTAIK